jgi:hypothetical protein
MTLQERIIVLQELGNYLQTNDSYWQSVKEQANMANPWFVPEFIEMAAKNIAEKFLDEQELSAWIRQYNVPTENMQPATVGLVMAGNIPMVGFHDMLCIFVSGHVQRIKLSSKDLILPRHLIEKMIEINPEVKSLIYISENLKGCDAYIATGSNNSSRYFDYYFGRYPNIIRKNRTSVAILDGTESSTELESLADDIQMYFGLGCRNVTKLYVPEEYNFENLLGALNKYEHYADFHKYKNNYDYQLALMMMGNKFYMTNGTVILSKNPWLFTAVSQVNYEYYQNKSELQMLRTNAEVQCIVGHDEVPFGMSQRPSLYDYPDGVDTLQFLLSLNKHSTAKE